MKTLVFGIIALLTAGCASTSQNAATPATAFQPIDGSSIVIKQDLRFLPSLSGYLLPAGTYLPVSKDAQGVYYQSPTGVVALSVVGGTRYPGGIYRFRYRDGSVGLKVWCKTVLGMEKRDLYSMIGANLEKNLVYNE